MSSNTSTQKPLYSRSPSSTTTTSTSSSLSDEIHGHITKQMQVQQDRWSAWQAKQLELYQGAATAPVSEHNGSFHRRITSKRPHIHLGQVSATLRKIRG
ncbi:hypothetical protein PV11_02529 [Exophiala sideris]|uniref:Uncharacterized protein n=1 Tax=Exophiala sideris TaxID=1016849 RepID=A0A0D1YZJ8_9EURO|nr:hypothetical protein PV11_02529 [Exophiala sideris]